ncbi:MAG: HD domain-containing protein [Rubrobacteraceae bacterium]
MERALAEVPELGLSRGLAQSPYHHLDTLDHILEVVRLVERELERKELGAVVVPERISGLRLAALLHDVAKPVTRGEYEGKVIFVAHDTLGAMMARKVCDRLSASAIYTDMAVSLTALHLKIGFMGSPRADYPPDRLVRAAGPFGEELAVLSWADRLAAQGPRLRDEHLERHLSLCKEFLELSRKSGPYSEPDYGGLRGGIRPDLSEADVGYAAARLRLLAARGVGREEALGCVSRLL